MTEIQRPCTSAFKRITGMTEMMTWPLALTIVTPSPYRQDAFCQSGPRSTNFPDELEYLQVKRDVGFAVSETLCRPIATLTLSLLRSVRDNYAIPLALNLEVSVPTSFICIDVKSMPVLVVLLQHAIGCSTITLNLSTLQGTQHYETI